MYCGKVIVSIFFQVQFLKKAVDILCQCRQTLMYTYVFAYYLKKNNQSVIFEVIVLLRFQHSALLISRYSFSHRTIKGIWRLLLRSCLNISNATLRKKTSWTSNRKSRISIVTVTAEEEYWLNMFTKGTTRNGGSTMTSLLTTKADQFYVESQQRSGKSGSEFI